MICDLAAKHPQCRLTPAGGQGAEKAVTHLYVIQALECMYRYTFNPEHTMKLPQKPNVGALNIYGPSIARS